MALSFFDVSALNGINGFVIGETENRISIDSAGDVNNDNIPDLVLSAPEDDTNGENAGRGYVLFGSRAGFVARFDLATLNGANGFRLNGLTAGDRLGAAASAIGDINNDGIADLVFGAPGANPNGDNSGQSYVIFGRSSFDATLNLSNLNGTNGFVINGAALNDESGASLAIAGDVNGDSFDDVLIGTALGKLSFTGGNTPGELFYLIFGKSGGFPPTLNLANLDGASGLRFTVPVFSSPPQTLVTSYVVDSVSRAGDINNDGIDDFIVGIIGTTNRSGSSELQAFVVFGSRSGLPDLPALNGTNGFKFSKTLFFFPLSFEAKVSGIGDINADGIDDVAIGSVSVSVAGAVVGQVSVVFGSASGFPAALSDGNLNGTNGFNIPGFPGTALGRSVSGAGDINGDGIDDLLIGQPGLSGTDAPVRIHVVFGDRDGFSANFDLASLDGTNGFSISSAAGVAGSADVNGDGTRDLLLNGADESYVVFNFADAIANLTLSPYLVDASNVSLGSINANLTTGILEATTATGSLRRSIFGFTNINGTALNDVITGNQVANILNGGGGNDEIRGEAGADILFGQVGNDTLIGGRSFDLLRGGQGMDTLRGGLGNDTLFGGRGADSLTGGVGDDQLTGGLGRDRFAFSIGKAFDNTIGVDAIADFTQGDDSIVLLRDTFTALGSSVSFATVETVTQAQTSDALITYIQSTGAIYYNENGTATGFGTGGQFANVAGGLALGQSDFAMG